MTPLAIVGVGKIARDQHIPAIRASAHFDLAATVSRSGAIEGVENYTSIEALLAARPDIPAVSLSMPPAPRYAAAQAAIAAGRHVMLEKPPGASLAEVETLRRQASEAGVTLFASWHSRAAGGVAPARRWLANQVVRRVRIAWKEDVRKWHPDQNWIWEPGGLGVFDPGINAFSILTEILPVPLRVSDAQLTVPQNCATPIAAEVAFAGPGGLEATASLDWRHQGPEIREIEVETDDGILRLVEGGARVFVGDTEREPAGQGEYPGLYGTFGALIAGGWSDVDLLPFIHVADAFMLARHDWAEAFHW